MKKLLYSLIFLVAQVSAQSKLSDRDSVNWLLDSTQHFILEEKKIHLNHALFITKKIGWKEKEAEVLLKLAVSSHEISDYESSMKYLEQSYSIIDALNLVKLKSYVYFFRGENYSRLGQFDLAKKEYFQSMKIADSNQDSVWIGRNLNSLGTVASKKMQQDSALLYFQKALSIAKNIPNEDLAATISNNIAVVFMLTNQAKDALLYLSPQLLSSRKNGNKLEESQSLGNYAYTYAMLKNYPKAFAYYDSCVSLAVANDFKEVLFVTYKDISDTYLAMNNYEKAIEYLNKYQILKEKVTGEKSQSKIAELEVKYDSERKQLMITQLNQRQTLLYVSIFALLIICLLIFLKLRSDLRRNRELNKIQGHLLESESKNNELSNSLLKEQLAHKNVDLANLALDIARKNEFSIELASRIKLIEKSPPENIKQHIKKLLFFVQNHLQVSEDLELFQQNVEHINRDFFHKLEEIAPDLTINDKELCGLIRLNLTNKEIAGIKKISDASAKMARYRLRKKLGLEAEEDIVTFLQNV
jgi:tetratricopeptide (TPR) repeat protein